MRAQPKTNLINLFRKRKNRKYIILITKNDNAQKNIIIDSLSFNAKVGVIGHELAHISQYTQNSIFNLICYSLSKKVKRQVETSADKICIQKGLGFPLYEFRNYTQNISIRDQKKKDNTEKYYLSIEEILDEMKRRGLAKKYFFD